jgi:6-phosphofructokinase 1
VNAQPPPASPADIAALDLRIEQVGEAALPSPLRNATVVDDGERISYFAGTRDLAALQAAGLAPPGFEAAGPRARIFHDPAWTRAAIVTCGGLCPGLNNVIKALVTTLYSGYGVDNVFGVRYGYRGLNPAYGLEPLHLDPDLVDEIHEKGGSILGSSRGAQETAEIVRTLDRLRLNVLFCIGGDGTLRGARDIALEATRRNLPLSVVGIPKTIDNDIDFMDRTFGFETAVLATHEVISCAHAEAKGAVNGVSIVRLMGRDSGFIAAYAALANPVVNVCLVPEVPFTLDGPGGLLPALAQRLARKRHAVIVVAEGAGQELFRELPETRDASGNVIHHDIGLFLRDRISAYLKSQRIDHAMKYFDPSYLIRGIPARGTDAVFCLHLAENAVHAAMAGRTNMVVGHWHGRFTHVPIALAVQRRRKLDPDGQIWKSVQAANAL